MSSPRTSAVLLAAGYGTRMYPLTKDCPKALLPLGEGVILDWILDAVWQVPAIGDIVLIANHRFIPQLEAWLQARQRPITLVDDGTSVPEDRLGAVRDLLLAMKRIGQNDDALVLGTDNLFTWPLSDLVDFARMRSPAATVAIRRVASGDEASRCAVVDVDAKGRLTRCAEKPLKPFSLLAALCVYYFPAPMRQRIDEFVRGGGNADAPGYFLEWLVKQETVYGFMTAGEWFDIGSQEAYEQAAGRLLPRPQAQARLASHQRRA